MILKIKKIWLSLCRYIKHKMRVKMLIFICSFGISVWWWRIHTSIWLRLNTNESNANVIFNGPFKSKFKFKFGNNCQRYNKPCKSIEPSAFAAAFTFANVTATSKRITDAAGVQFASSADNTKFTVSAWTANAKHTNKYTRNYIHRFFCKWWTDKR